MSDTYDHDQDQQIEQPQEVPMPEMKTKIVTDSADPSLLNISLNNNDAES
jgi:hypothetical protein